MKSKIIVIIKKMEYFFIYNLIYYIFIKNIKIDIKYKM